MMVVYALWILSALLVIVGSTASDLHLSIVEERRATERAELRAAAISGLEAYRMVLAENANRKYSHRGEVFRTGRSLCSFVAGNGIRTLVYHMEEGGDDGWLRPVWGASDEESRLNLLKADSSSVVLLPGVSPDMVEDLRRFRSEHPGFEPTSLFDLRSVPGWQGLNPAEIGLLVTFVGRGKVNANTASPGVLRLLGLSDRAISELNRFLAGPNEVRGDEDDRYFRALYEIEAELRDFSVDPGALKEWREVMEEGWVTVLSEHYRIQARSVSETTGRQYEVDALVRVDDDITKLLWEEYQP